MDFSTFVQVREALDAIVNTGEFTARGACGMLIDMVCARYGGDPVEFADDVAQVVRHVNDNMGNCPDYAKAAL